MDVYSFARVIAETGLAIGILILFYILLRDVLNKQSKIMDQAKEERESWLSTIAQINNTLKEHNEHEHQLYTHTAEAHRYQRQEHDRQSEQHESLINILQMIERGISALK